MDLIISNMKKTILISMVMVMTKTTAYTQSDSTWWYDHINNMLQQASTPIERAEAYYTDFIFCHGGHGTPYYPYYLYHEDRTERIQAFPYSADSALSIFYTQYRKKGNKHLYYPIVQLEHSLGLKHKTSIVPPKTSKYYLPIQSATDTAILTSGWETNYSKFLFPTIKWALGHCKAYTKLFRKLKEPDLWNQQHDTVIRLTCDHLPGTEFDIVRVYKSDGQPIAQLQTGHIRYSKFSSSYHIVRGKKIKKTLTQEQWQNVLVLATAIDSLPWFDKRMVIDGNRYQFEYRHGTSYHSHYSCFDDTRLTAYLYSIFESYFKQQ